MSVFRQTSVAPAFEHFTWQDLNRRRLQPELMDAPGLAPEEHARALKGLRRINLISRSDQILWEPLRRILSQWQEARPLRILDVATGAGDVPLRLARRAAAEGQQVEFSACDMSGTAIDFAREESVRQEIAVGFFQHDVLESDMPQGYDVILCSLFLHHLPRPKAVKFLQNAREAAGTAVLVNDLLRSKKGFALALAGTRLLSRSNIVHNDGLLSVQAAFTMEEVRAMAAKAGMEKVWLARHWPERFLLEWRRDVE